MMKKVVYKVVSQGRKIFGRKQPAGSKAIIVEVILLLLAIAALLLYKTNLVDMVQDVIASCKEQIMSIIK